FTNAARCAAMAARRSSPDAPRTCASRTRSDASRKCSSVGRSLRASWLTAHTTAVGRRSAATSFASASRPPSRSSFANASRARTNSAGSTANRSRTRSFMTAKRTAAANLLQRRALLLVELRLRHLLPLSRQTLPLVHEIEDDAQERGEHRDQDRGEEPIEHRREDAPARRDVDEVGARERNQHEREPMRSAIRTGDQVAVPRRHAAAGAAQRIKDLLLG